MKQNRLFLFDIDGTLLWGRGAPRRVFMKILRRRFGPRFTNHENMRFSGLTDPLILKRLLEMNGFEAKTDERFINELLDEIVPGLAGEINRENPPDILPGVKPLLQNLKEKANCFLGLVTGNVMSAAHIKLRACGLYDYFPVGAFGSDDYYRDNLPPVAIDRARNYYNREFDKNNTWIIGDSIHDVRCAKVNGLRSLAVATGPTDIEELSLEKPDVFFENLNSINDVLKSLNL